MIDTISIVILQTIGETAIGGVDEVPMYFTAGESRCKLGEETVALSDCEQVMYHDIDTGHAQGRPRSASRINHTDSLSYWLERAHHQRLYGVR